MVMFRISCKILKISNLVVTDNYKTHSYLYKPFVQPRPM